MRHARLIIPDTAIYHCMSRTVNGEALFARREKEVLRKMIAQAADFSGVEVLTYCIMNNHFHVLARVVPCDYLSDQELMRRYEVLYPKPTKYQTASIAVLKQILAADGDEAAALREQLLARMGDISQFMKTVKQRFSIWFNKTHHRFGPLWSDRFKSVLVEGKGHPLQIVAAYIDLNPVRAGLVEDPKDYRFCGYAEAVAGNKNAISSIGFICLGLNAPSPQAGMQSYRELLFGKGAAPASESGSISRAKAIKVLEKEQGALPTAVLLRCRIRYLTEGAILGSSDFIRSHAADWQRMGRRKHPPKARKIRSADGDGISVMRHGRGKVFF